MTRFAEFDKLARTTSFPTGIGPRSRRHKPKEKMRCNGKGCDAWLRSNGRSRKGLCSACEQKLDDAQPLFIH